MGGGILLGLVLLVGGTVGYRYAYELARFGERVDSIGSTTQWNEVEPAHWNVYLNKVIAVTAALIGGLVLLGSLL